MTNDDPINRILVGEHSHPQKTPVIVWLLVVVVAGLALAVVLLGVHSHTRQNQTDAHNAQTARCLGGILNAAFVPSGSPTPTAQQFRHIVMVDCAALLHN